MLGARALLLMSVVLLMGAAPMTVPTTQKSSPIAPGAKPIKVGEGYKFSEGATSDKDGNVYFVDQPNDRIMHWTFEDGGEHPEKGTMTLFMSPSGYANGMCFDGQGQLIVCADEKNELWSIQMPAKDEEKKKVSVLLTEHDGKLLNGPNDVWIRPDGGMYLTDPLYPRPWWGKLRPVNDRVSQQPGRYVYYLGPGRKGLVPVVTDFKQPNGIIGTPDGKTLYVSDIDGGQTWQYAIQPDGTLADKKLFCKTGSDGMTIDDEGNIYTTHFRNGVQIWNRQGALVEKIPLPSGNVCFGGKQRDVLFINTPNAVYVLKMRTHGVGPQ